MSEFLARMDDRETVVDDMLTDLFSKAAEHVRFPYGYTKRRLRHPEKYLFSVANSPDLQAFDRDNPECGNPAFLMSETSAAITQAARIVGGIGLREALEDGVHDISLRIEGQRHTPGAFVDSWAELYAKDMARAVHLGLTKEMAEVIS